MKGSRLIVIFIPATVLLLTITVVLAGIQSPGGNPIVGYKFNGNGGALGVELIAQTELLSEVFVIDQTPFEKQLKNESDSLSAQFEFEGYLLEFVDYLGSDPTKLVVTSFFDDPSTGLRSSQVDTISNTRSASTLAQVVVRTNGSVMRFGPWQGHSDHIADPQDETSPPAPNGTTVFTEDWQDQDLVSGMSIQPYVGANVSIHNGILKIWGDESAYAVITLPPGVVCLAMYGIDPLFIGVPLLDAWGMLLLTSALLLIAIFLLAIRGRIRVSEPAT